MKVGHVYVLFSSAHWSIESNSLKADKTQLWANTRSVLKVCWPNTNFTVKFLMNKSKIIYQLVLNWNARYDA